MNDDDTYAVHGRCINKILDFIMEYQFLCDDDDFMDA